MAKTKLQQDRLRYPSYKDMPMYQIFFRLAQQAKFGLTRKLWQVLFTLARKVECCDWSTRIQIGGGLYIGHYHCITVNADAVIGKNCNIHKGVTIGQTNRGKKKGVPRIGDNVWIGINATIVGGIEVGDDVLIAPNSYVNVDIPSHSVVIGNPCVIHYKDNATEGYINKKVE